LLGQAIGDVQWRVGRVPFKDPPNQVGYPLPELAWSEMRYPAYSYVTPRL
jgi:hypothetical protein